MSGRLTTSDRLLITAALVVLGYLLILDLGIAWGGCHNPNTQTQAQQYANQDDCTVNGIRLAIVDLGDAVHQRKDDLTAVSTAIIAIFTIVLARVTGRQARLTKLVADAGKEAADAAKASADALPTLERAYIFLEFNPWFVPNMQRILLRQPRPPVPPFAGIDQPTVEYQFVNHGKTPAIVKATSGVLEHLTTLPDQIRYADLPLEDVAVIPGGGSVYPALSPGTAGGQQTLFDTSLVKFLMRAHLGRELGEAEIDSLRAGHSFLWFYGHVVYDDVFGREHETRFCWCYNGVANTFQQYGQEYNERT